MNHQDIIDRIDASWAEFRPLLDGISDNDAMETLPSGDWNIRDIVGHLAFWERRAADHVAGNPVDSDPAITTINERNAAEYERISKLSFAEALDQLDSAHEFMRATVRAHPEVSAEDVEGDTWEHFEEHGADIRAWLERR